MLLTSEADFKELISQVWYTETSKTPFKAVSTDVLPRLHEEQGFFVCAHPVPVLNSEMKKVFIG